MKFQQLFSGSKANAYVVTSNSGKRLLIECGCTWAKLQKALDYDLDLVGCLISHAHQDHCKCIWNVMNSGIDTYAGLDTFLLAHYRSNVVKGKDSFWIGGFEIYCFDVNHDVPALGFVVREKDESLLFVTDSSHITQKFMTKFSIIAIECSYNADTLAERVAAGEINETYAKRLIDSHMSKQETMRYLDEFCDLTHCRQIHLIHMSDENIIRDRIAREIEDRFMIETVVV